MNENPRSSDRPPGPPAPQQPPELPLWRYLVWILFALAIIYYWSAQSVGQAQRVTYTQFKEWVRTDQVAEVILQGDNVSGQLRIEVPLPPELGSPEADGDSRRFATTLPPVDDPELMPLLEEHGVAIDARSQQSPWWTQALFAVLPWLLILFLFFFLTRRWQERIQGGGNLFGFGKSRARRYQKGTMNVTFDDVAGLAGAKQDLREITEYLKNPDQFRELGAKIPKGILLMGPPGTGKTLLAKAVAGEADVPFFSISGSQFIEMFVGVGAARVRDMFEDAKKNAPAIIFIDEIDSVGRARGTGLGGGHDEREQTLNQILNEMDGFDPHEAVVVLAATNRPDVLDNALVRPGRFDRKVVLDLPDKKARLAILGIHTRSVPMANDVDLDRLAALTVGFSGADLENVVNEAALQAGREDKHEVTMANFLAARDKVVLGAPRETVVGEEEKAVIAFHEAGHALAATLLPHADPLDKVTIIPRGRAMGATEQIPEEEHYNLGERYLKDRIGVMLGGRLAEKLVFDEVSSGAEEDLKQATRLARHMVAQWGMSAKLGPVAFTRGEEHIFLGREMAQQRDFSERTAQLIDEEIGQLLKGIESGVRELLKDHRQQLTALAEALLEKETLEAGEIQQLISHIPELPSRPAEAG